MNVIVQRGGTMRFMLSILLVVAVAGAALAGEHIEIIATRPGVTVPVYVQEAPAATSALLLFTGGSGQHFGEAGGKYTLTRNFLMRVIPQFVQHGLTVVVLGIPSDQHGTFSDDYRTSNNHTSDVQAVVQRMVAMGYRNIHFIGTSRGTISTAHLAATVKHEAVKGIVLTSTMNDAKFLRWIPLEDVSYPVLFVHHKNDYCKHTPVEEARRSASRMHKSPKVDFVELDGGLPAKSDECEPLSNHGFFGIEDKTVSAILQWVATQQQK